MDSSVSSNVVAPSSVVAPPVSNAVATSRSRAWCFTANLPDDQEITLLEGNIPQTDYCCYQYEQVSHRHIQGYVYFRNPRFFNAVRMIIKNWCGVYAHLAIARGTAQQNKEYCSKEESRIPGTTPQEHGVMPKEKGKGGYDILGAWKKFKEEGITEDLMQEFPNETTQYGRRFMEIQEQISGAHWKHRTGYHQKQVIVLWGDSRTGKTREAIEHGAIKAKYASRYTWGHYRGEPVVCFDEFNGQIPIEEILELTDGYATTVQIPFMGNKPWIPNTIYFCSNVEYTRWWKQCEPEQLVAFWNRVTVCIRFRFTELGIVKTYQKGRQVDEVVDQQDPLVEVEPADPPIVHPNELVTADNGPLF